LGFLGVDATSLISGAVIARDWGLGGMSFIESELSGDRSMFFVEVLIYVGFVRISL